MDGIYGCYNLGGIEGIRNKYPVVKAEGGELALIPFSSDIKLNCMIRDMNIEEKNPIDADNNMFVYLKGAPERVLNRCSTVLIDGKDVPFDSKMKFAADSANESFGGVGERVLAFARIKLDPKIFTKSPAYPFDVKNWKTWREVKSFD